MYTLRLVSGAINRSDTGAVASITSLSNTGGASQLLYPFNPASFSQLDSIGFTDSNSVNYIMIGQSGLDYIVARSPPNFAYEYYLYSTHASLISNSVCPSTSTSSCIAPANSSLPSYFHLSDFFPAYPNSLRISISFSLRLGAIFLSGASATSANAQYRLTSVIGSYTNNVTGVSTGIAILLPVNSYEYNDNLITPFATIQLSQISFEDVVGVTYVQYYNEIAYSQQNTGPYGNNEIQYCAITNTSCPQTGCVAPYCSSQPSYFSLSGTAPLSGGTVIYNVSLLLGATFQSGTNRTSPDAVYLLTSVYGSVQLSNLSAKTTSISFINVVEPVYGYQNNNQLYPFATAQLDLSGLAVQDSEGVLYRLAYSAPPYYVLNISTMVTGAALTSSYGLLISNTSCPSFASSFPVNCSSSSSSSPGYSSSAFSSSAVSSSRRASPSSSLVSSSVSPSSSSSRRASPSSSLASSSVPPSSSSSSASAQSCIAASASQPSYFYFSGSAYQFDPSQVLFTLSLTLGATFSTGTTTTSANALYICTSVLGSVTRNGNVTSITSLSTYASANQQLYPFQSGFGQLSMLGLSFQDSSGGQYNAYGGPSNYGVTIPGMGLFLDSIGPTLISNTSCPSFSSTSPLPSLSVVSSAVSSSPSFSSSAVSSSLPVISSTSSTPLLPSSLTSSSSLVSLSAMSSTPSALPSSAMATSSPLPALSYFQLSAYYVIDGVTYTLSLTLGASFYNGTSTTSADAVYLLITVSGSITQNNTGAAIPVTVVVSPSPTLHSPLLSILTPAGSAAASGDNELFPYGQQLDGSGINVQDSHGVQYTLYSSTGGFGITLLAQSTTYTLTPTGATLIVNSSSTSLSASTMALSSSTGNGAAYSDPFFSGFWRQTFYVHGRAGAVYSILSDRVMSLQSRFVFLTNISCPDRSGAEVQVHCSSHAGMYFGSFHLNTRSGDRLTLIPDAVHVGFKLVELNGVQVEVGTQHGAVLPQQRHSHHSHAPSSTPLDVTTDHTDSEALLDSTSEHGMRDSIFVHRLSFRSLIVHAGLYELSIECADRYLDLVQVTVSSWPDLLNDVQPEGLLGRTWNATADMPPDEELYRLKEDGDMLGCSSDRDRFCRANGQGRGAVSQ